MRGGMPAIGSVDGPVSVGVGICANAADAMPMSAASARPAVALKDLAGTGPPWRHRERSDPALYRKFWIASSLRLRNDGLPQFRYNTLMSDAASDPLAWRRLKAPSLVELEVLASEVFRHMPRRFRDLCVDLVIQVDDFASEEVLDQMDAESEFDLLGLFQGVGLPFRAESSPVQMPNMIWLYRRPILDYWAEHDETLDAIVKHVLVHEIGHHFGLSDDDMEAIENSAEEAKGAVP